MSGVPSLVADADLAGALLQVVQGDITQLDVDVVVNAANSSLLGGGGVDGAIHRAAGPALLEACREVIARHGGCAPGEAVITGAGDLEAQHVVHTVGPVFNGSNDTDPTLAHCYARSLDLAATAGARSIAFPNISTGVYRYPKERAQGIALRAVTAWLAANPYTSLKRVVFCCFDPENTQLYTTAFETLA